MRVLLTVFLCLALSTTLWATDDWELVRDARARDDVMTWVRPVPGNPLKAFKGRIEVPLPMLTVMAVLADTENYPQWVFQCDEAHLLPELGPEFVYIHVAGIWPVDDRDMPLRNHVQQNPDTLAVTLTSTVEPDLIPTTRNTVRVPSLNNTFLIEPLSDGWTRVTFQTFVDPGGLYPFLASQPGRHSCTT